MKYCKTGLIVQMFFTGVYLYANDFTVNFNHPQELPYLWKKVTTYPYSPWTSYGFDKRKKMFWIKFIKKPIAYMFYKLIKLNSRNFYKFKLQYHTKYETYFMVYLKYIDKNFKHRGYQILYKNKLKPEENFIEIEFEPAKKIKKAILYISILYVKHISKIYINSISLKRINKIYSNFDGQYIIPSQKIPPIKISYSIFNRNRLQLEVSFDSIFSNGVRFFYQRMELKRKKGSVKIPFTPRAGLYLFRYSVITEKDVYKNEQILWITSYFYYFKKQIYVYNPPRQLFLPAIPVISFLNFNKKLYPSALLEPFLKNEIFSQYYPVEHLSVFFRDNYSVQLLNYMKENHKLKNLFLIVKKEESLIRATPLYPKILDNLLNISFIKEESRKADMFFSTNSAGKKDFIFINRIKIDDFPKLIDKKIAVNYDNFAKFIPVLFLMILTRNSILLQEPDFPPEYNFFLNKDKTITVIKYSDEPINISMFPIQQILINRELSLNLFGYESSKKIYILKFKGELPSSLRKTINSVYIFPRSLFAPAVSIKSFITLTNYFNEEIEVKHITIETDKKWDISIGNKRDNLKSGKSMKIPFFINFPPVTPLRRYVFLLKIKLFHSKIGEISIEKLFTLGYKSREFEVRKQIEKAKEGMNITLNFKNKRRKASLYYIVVVQPPQLLKEEISVKLNPKGRESTYIKLPRYRRGQPVILSIRNAVTKQIFFLEILPRS